MEKGGLDFDIISAGPDGIEDSEDDLSNAPQP